LAERNNNTHVHAFNLRENHNLMTRLCVPNAVIAQQLCSNNKHTIKQTH